MWTLSFELSLPSMNKGKRKAARKIRLLKFYIKWRDSCNKYCIYWLFILEGDNFVSHFLFLGICLLNHIFLTYWICVHTYIQVMYWCFLLHLWGVCFFGICFKVCLGFYLNEVSNVLFCILVHTRVYTIGKSFPICPSSFNIYPPQGDFGPCFWNLSLQSLFQRCCGDH